MRWLQSWSSWDLSVERNVKWLSIDIGTVSRIIPKDYIDSPQKETMQYWLLVAGGAYLRWQKYTNIETEKAAVLL